MKNTSQVDVNTFLITDPSRVQVLIGSVKRARNRLVFCRLFTEKLAVAVLSCLAVSYEVSLTQPVSGGFTGRK
jgi:hypothetical protein